MATDFFFSFISLLSISCFLISFFFSPFFFVSFCHSPLLSLISFVFTSLLPQKIIFLCSFRFSCRFCLVASASFFVWTLLCFLPLVFLLCSVVFFYTIYLLLFDRFSSFGFSCLCSYSSFFLFFLLCIFLFFPSCVHISLFLKKSVCFMLVSFLPFSFCFDLFQQNISFLLSHSPCFSTFFQNKSFFLLIFFSFLVFIESGKSPCSNFHFDRPHSNTYVSRFFFYLLTLFMFSTPLYVPSWYSLSLCPPSSLLLSFFFVAKHFEKKKKLSLTFIVPRPSCFFSVSFVVSSFHIFLWNPFSFSSPFWFRLYLCCIFQSCSFEKNDFSHQKNPFLTFPKLFFLKTLENILMFSLLLFSLSLSNVYSPSSTCGKTKNWATWGGEAEPGRFNGLCWRSKWRPC